MTLRNGYNPNNNFFLQNRGRLQVPVHRNTCKSEKWPGDQEGEEEKDVAFVLLLKNVE